MFFLINNKHYYHIYEYDSNINQIKIDGLFIHCPLNNNKIIFNPVSMKIKHNFKIDKMIPEPKRFINDFLIDNKNGYFTGKSK